MDNYNRIKRQYQTSNFRKSKLIDRNRINSRHFLSSQCLFISTNKLISSLNNRKLFFNRRKFKKNKLNLVKTSLRIYNFNITSDHKRVIKKSQIIFNKRHYTRSSLKIYHINKKNYILFNQNDFLDLIDYENYLKQALAKSKKNAIIEKSQRKHMFRNFLQLEYKFEHLRSMLDDANRDNLELSNELKTAKELLFKESKRMESTLKEYNQIMNERDVVHKEMEAMMEKLNKYEDMNKSFNQQQKTSQKKLNSRDSSIQKNINLVEEFDKFIETNCQVKLNGSLSTERKASNSDLNQNEKINKIQLIKNRLSYCENENGWLIF
jgi:hypothetical protein